MGELIDDLLTFSRLSRQPLSKQTVDTGKLVRGILEELNSQQNGRRIEFRIADLPPCQADPALLKQVWANLLSNALKYTGKHESALVEIGCAMEKGRNVYFVRDNGTGFDMRYAHKLFGVFQRLHRAEDYEGTGVGLAIVQRVIHRHGGRVWAESAVNSGATFSFHTGRRNRTMNDTNNIIEILLVEDNPQDIQLTLRALKKANLANHIQVARDGEEALQIIFCEGPYAGRKIENAPKVVLLDLKLPKVDGMEVLARMKSDPRTKMIPVVVLTSSKEQSDLVESYKLGVNSYIVKPVNFERIRRGRAGIGNVLAAAQPTPQYKGIICLNRSKSCSSKTILTMPKWFCRN